MKIEKVNDNQIRCTLTKEDLASREIKLSELAYGTEKAKSLFRDMMQQANFEFGFEAEDIPLMIEAIPLNADCIVLIITKVEDPEELDTRFSRFSPSEDDEDEEDEGGDTLVPSPKDEMEELFSGVKASKEPISPSHVAGVVRTFYFNSLSQVIDAAKVVGPDFTCPNTLYKDAKSGQYLLVLTLLEEAKAEFNCVCNNLSEYGFQKSSLPINKSYFEEHFEVIVKDNALTFLSVIK